MYNHFLSTTSALQSVLPQQHLSMHCHSMDNHSLSATSIFEDDPFSRLSGKLWLPGDTPVVSRLLQHVQLPRSIEDRQQSQLRHISCNPFSNVEEPQHLNLSLLSQDISTKFSPRTSVLEPTLKPWSVHFPQGPCWSFYPKNTHSFFTTLRCPAAAAQTLSFQENPRSPSFFR